MAKIIEILTKDERLRLKALKDALNTQKEVNKELMELEILEQDAGEPLNDMPQDGLQDDSGDNLPNNNDSSNNINEIIIKLKNSSSEEKTLIIKYTN